MVVLGDPPRNVYEGAVEETGSTSLCGQSPRVLPRWYKNVDQGSLLSLELHSTKGLDFDAVARKISRRDE